MAKNKLNRLLNQSFQQGCARPRYTTFDNFSLARIEPDGRISVRICSGTWLKPMSQLPIELFRGLPVWQQRQLVESDFTLNRGFAQAKP